MGWKEQLILAKLSDQMESKVTWGCVKLKGRRQGGTEGQIKWRIWVCHRKEIISTEKCGDSLRQCHQGE